MTRLLAMRRRKCVRVCECHNQHHNWQQEKVILDPDVECASKSASYEDELVALE